MAKVNHKIILAGGGTAGHVLPLIEIEKRLSKKGKFNFEIFGTGSSFERKIARENRISYQKIFSGKLRRNLTALTLLQNTTDLFLLTLGVLQAILLFLGNRPSLIFSKGGFASLPTVIAGALLKVPIIAHESDVVPGLANRLTLNFAKRIATAFPPDIYPLAIRKKSFFAGIPLQNGFYDNSNLGDKGYILIFGGSQGASSLNELVFCQLEKILKIAPVVHLTGRVDYEKALEIRSKLRGDLKSRYSVYSFRDDMSRLIGASRIVICRAGATSIFEAAAFSKNLLLVPIPRSVTKHQFVNAMYLKSKGLCEVFNQGENSSKLLELINKLYRSKQRDLSQLKTPWSAEVISDAIFFEIENHLFLSRVKKIFFIGMGGVSMKAVMTIFGRMGKKVYGSDIKFGGHDAKNISKDLDLVVYSSAASEKSMAKEEHDQAEKYKIEKIKRSQAIGILMRTKSGISVSGMHGKTTTSALIARVLSKSGLEPSYLIGAPPTNSVPNSRYTSSEYFVSEACEYDGSFLDFPTTVAVITNIDEEHLDYFKNGLKDIEKVFSQFICKIRYGGLLIYNRDDKNSVKVVNSCKDCLLKRNITSISFGFDDLSDIKISSYKPIDSAISFKLSCGGDSLEIRPKVAGKHFAYNCACSFAVSNYLGINPLAFQLAADSFVGAKGRFELLGSKRGVPVFYDYGHHPTELRAVFSSINDLYKDKRKIFVFEPHQQSRFDSFFDDFYKEIMDSRMDVVGILPVHRVAGRDVEAKFTSRDLVDKLTRGGKKSFLFDTYEEAELFLRKNHRVGDFVITVGATEVWRVGEGFIKK